MKNVLGNVISSAIFSSLLGGVVILLEMMVLLVINGSGGLISSLGGAFLIYFIVAIVACLLAVFIAGPVYLLLTRYKLANYFSCALLGGLMVFLSIGLPTSLTKLFLCFTGGLIGVLFHYHYTHKPQWLEVDDVG